MRAPRGYTFPRLSTSDLFFNILTRPGSSKIGVVSGGQTILVTPPALAAFISLSNVDLY